MNIFYGGFKNKLIKDKEKLFKTAIHDMKCVLDKNNQQFFFIMWDTFGTI